MFEVPSGPRVLRFEGRHLANSSSWRRGASRWIEFDLYKSDAGKYILARVGVSLVYHSVSCPLVRKYGLHEGDLTELSKNAVSCPECAPGYDDPLIYPEEDRTWTMVSDDPEAVVAALYKEDQSGAKYLTRVAERLLQDAAAQDAGIDLIYRFEYID